MVLSIYKRFSESTNFCSKERLLRSATARGYDARVCQKSSTRAISIFIATRATVDPHLAANQPMLLEASCPGGQSTFEPYDWLTKK